MRMKRWKRLPLWILATAVGSAAACADAPEARTGERPSLEADSVVGSAVDGSAVEARPAEQVVAVYFPCDTAMPGSLCAADRRVDDPALRLERAMQALVAGPTASEREHGYRSFFSDATADALLSARTNAAGDTAWLDFRDFSAALPDQPAVKSFLPPGVMASLTWTVFKSFPRLDAVHFSFEGSERAFWGWLDGSPVTFTRRAWEQI